MISVRSLSAICLVLFFASCSRDTEFETALDAAAAKYRGTALARELEALDQRFPDRLLLKVDLGAIFLASGDMARAASYLDRGEILARRSSDDGILYLLYANLAELRLRTRSFDASIASADRALASAGLLKGGDRLGAVFAKAKALASLGRKDEALAVFDAVRGEAAGTMTAEDFSVHARLLAERGRFADALLRLKERRGRFGYSAGQGLEESVLFEKLGKPAQAAAMAFEDLDRRRFHAGLSDSALLTGLAAAKKRLAAAGPREKDAIKSAAAVLDGAELYVRGGYGEASAVFTSIAGAESGNYLDFLAAASAAEAGNAGSVELLAAMESRYRDFQGYYYHLWRGMKKRGGRYGLETVRGLLERCILLSPGSEAARETREELGLALGIGTEEGGKLLLGPELEKLAAALAGGAGPEILAPAVELLAAKDNPYRLAGQILLKKAADLPAARHWLEKRRAEAGGRLREGLAAVLDR